MFLSGGTGRRLEGRVGVDPAVHTGERKPTQLFNGYGEYVADIYKGLEKERLWA